MILERGFQEISVTSLGYQTAAQRFGALHIPPAPQPGDSDSDDDQVVEDTHALRVEEWRMNLTVLSQYYNLYFAVYGDKIYVYRPRNPQQALPREPDLILEPPQSREARCKIPIVNISRYRGHIINHLVIGNLGDKEILLCACYDGDVVAYYTQAIENAIGNALAGYTSIVKWFFAEYVGDSAWALAIHSQSRLIAVGSNAHEIQVFAFALSASAYEGAPLTGKPNRTKISALPISGYVQFPKANLLELSRTHCGKVIRDRNFRLIFKLGANGDNIPSVAFSNSAEGDADTIIAVDIRGALWFFKLWEDAFKCLPYISEPSGADANTIGWGVLVLPRYVFKPTHDLADTFGWPKSLSSLLVRKGIMDISKTVQDVRDSSVWHEIFDINIGEEDDDEEDNEEESDRDSDGMNNALDTSTVPDLEMVLAEPDVPISFFHEEQDSLMSGPEEHIIGMSSTNQQAQNLVNQITPLQSSPMLEEPFLARNKVIEKNKYDAFQLSRSGELILQSFRHSITLHPTQDDTLPTQCDNLLRQDLPHDDWFPRPLADYDRLNMLATIPELSLVLVASQIGRVALITITRPVRRDSSLGHIVSMRVDLILPFKHEEKEKIRPSHGLLGMAVGPMQAASARMVPSGLKDRKGPRRWRLMLHYFNHTILSYEISREEETGELLVL